MGRGRQTMGLALNTGRLAMLQRRELSKAANRDKVAHVPSKPPKNNPTIPGGGAAVPGSAANILGRKPAKDRVTGSLPNVVGGSAGSAAPHGMNQPHGSGGPGGVPTAHVGRVSVADPAKPVAASGSVGDTVPNPPPGAVGGAPGGSSGSSSSRVGASATTRGGSSSSAPRPPGSNVWRLHPALPVDVRLLGVGLVAAGAAYLYGTGTFGDPFGQDASGGGSGARSAGGSNTATADDRLEEPSAAIIREEHDSALGFTDEEGQSGDGSGSDGSGLQQPEYEKPSADSNEARLWASKQAALRPPYDTASLSADSSSRSYSHESDSARGSSGDGGGIGDMDAATVGRERDVLSVSGAAVKGSREGEQEHIHAGGPTLEHTASLPPSSTAQVQDDDGVSGSGNDRSSSDSGNFNDEQPVDTSSLADLFNSVLSPGNSNANASQAQEASSERGGAGEGAASSLRQAADDAEAAVAPARQTVKEAAGIDSSNNDSGGGGSDGNDRDSDKDRDAGHEGAVGSHTEERARIEAQQGADESHERALGFTGLEMPFMGDSDPSPGSSSQEAAGPAGSDSRSDSSRNKDDRQSQVSGNSGGSASIGSGGSGRGGGNGGDDPNEPGRTKGMLGLEDDLTSRNLVAVAMERDEGEDILEWLHYKARRRQALSDARTFEDALRSAQDFHQREVRQREEATDSKARAVQQLQDLLQQQADDRVRVERFIRHQAKQNLAQELRRQGSQIEAAAQEAANEERRARGRELDSLRIRLGALGRAFSTRSNETQISHQAHKVALSVMALQGALQQGAPFQAQLESLAVGGQDDPLIRAALAALPQQLADSGLPTSEQLSSRFSEVSRSVAQLSYLPRDSIGLLSLAACKLAAGLKVREMDTYQKPVVASEGVVSHGPSEALAAARGALSRGDLLSAATLLEQSASGSAAEAVSAEWVAAARARASADQTLTLLQAHATAITSSLT